VPREKPEPSSDNTCEATGSTNSTDQSCPPKLRESHDEFLTPTRRGGNRGTGEAGSPAAATGTKIRSFQSAENGAAASGVPASAASPAGVDMLVVMVVGPRVPVTEHGSG
jgi:hypothetical protein